MSITNNNSDKEREVQDEGDGDEDVMYEPLLHDIDAATLMYEDDFEVETGSREGLRGVEQEEPALRDEGRLAARESLGISGEERVDRRPLHEHADRRCDNFSNDRYLLRTLICMDHLVITSFTSG